MLISNLATHAITIHDQCGVLPVFAKCLKVCRGPCVKDSRGFGRGIGQRLDMIVVGFRTDTHYDEPTESKDPTHDRHERSEYDQDQDVKRGCD